MQHLDEGTIHAWLDGALAPNEAIAVEQHVHTCEQCALAVAEARGLVAASSRILAALDDVPAVQEPLRLPVARLKRSWWRRGGIGYAAAATVLLAAGTTLVFRIASNDALMDAPSAAVSRQPDISVLDSAVPAPPRTARTAANETETSAAPTGARTLQAARARETPEKSQAKEELTIDRIVPLPGPMPRPAAPAAAPGVRQPTERKAAADLAADASVSQRAAVVQGRVLDASTGAPVIGAVVSVDTGGAAAKAGRVAAQTDSAGTFKLQAVPLGQQTVNVQASGFRPVQHQLAVVPRESVSLGFALQKLSDDTGRAAAGAAEVLERGRARLPLQSQETLRDSLRQRQQAAPPILHLEGIRSNAENILGCYTLHVSQDERRDADKKAAASYPSFASLPQRVLLEGQARERAQREEPLVNRARTLAGSVQAHSWRFVGDSLELSWMDGAIRRTVRFGRQGSRWVSSAVVMERCPGQ